MAKKTSNKETHKWVIYSKFQDAFVANVEPEFFYTKDIDKAKIFDTRQKARDSIKKWGATGETPQKIKIEYINSVFPISYLQIEFSI